MEKKKKEDESPENEFYEKIMEKVAEMWFEHEIHKDDWMDNLLDD